MVPFGVCVLGVEIPRAYPLVPPLLSLSLEKSGDGPSILAKLTDTAEALARDGAFAMVWDLVQFLGEIADARGPEEKIPSSENTEKRVVRPSPTMGAASSSNECGHLDVALLLIDHMRERVKYMKRIAQWCLSLDITGHLFEFRRHFFLILEGELSSIQRSSLVCLHACILMIC
jgi:hypothetical protein